MARLPQAMWEHRPREVAYLLNPAFTSLILRSAAQGYRREGGTGIPFPQSFLLLPIVLHRPTRSILPRDMRTRLHTWIEDHSFVRVQFAERVTNLAPYTREALLFGIQHGVLTLSKSGTIDAPRCRLKPYNIPEGSEPSECLERAAFVGRWFARAGDVLTVLAMWGVKL